MSDDGSGDGLSGWAGVALGKMWAEHDQSMRGTLRRFANRRNSQASIADFQAANQAFSAQNQELAAENLRLRQALADYELNYNNLKAWAGRATAEIKQLKSERP